MSDFKELWFHKDQAHCDLFKSSQIPKLIFPG